ncbi:AbgT family transporter [Tindallia californiensis]|uniref:Aminobenzoyl-glutamate transport protein n=1 Tax=Tindallia californiensis TaxID=159292 RepID=A0A1H3P7W2_9FIRM|nr:AbgT family transporter [Tindallia californiensis]SDY97196.1 aminobenzoyl-glutamate transport protein [Tindallia californiensis]
MKVQIEQRSMLNKFLDFVERSGNKLPHPFTLFVILCVVVMMISLVASHMGISVIHPIDGQEIIVKNLLSGDGLQWMVLNLISNFTGFAPLGLVLTMVLGIGLAEKVGFMSAFMKKVMLGAPEKLLLLSVFFIGIVGNIASDAAIIIVPPLAGALFYGTKRNPLVGIAAGYAAACAGFTANIFIAGTDALLAGITEEAAQTIQPGIEVSPAVNYYFMIASTFVLTVVGAYITKRFVEPQAGEYIPEEDFELAEDEFKVSAIETKGLLRSGIASLIYWMAIVIMLIPQDSPFRGEGGTLVPSPFLRGIVPFILFWFIVIGVVYGITVGTIRSESDVPKLMTKAMEGMAGYIVLVFVIAQFVQYFNWTNIGMILAVSSANLIETLGWSGLPMVLGVLLVSTVVNIFIGSGAAKWALLSPVFVPMFMLLGYSPEYAQLAYRIGDSVTNAITPMFPYFPIVLGFFAKYDKEKAKIGTVMSMVMPYTIAFMVVWMIMLSVWHILGLPLGPGGSILL